MCGIVYAEERDFKSTWDEYKKGNYDTVLQITNKWIKEANAEVDPRIFYLYIATENDWKKMRSAVSRFQNSKMKSSPIFWNAIYLYLERALVLGDSEQLVQYGKLFFSEASSHPKATEAMFLYAYGLSDLSNQTEAIKILDEIEKRNPSNRLANAILELREEIKAKK
ncbi:hypothetical protein LPTSP4_17710 [Leptospira ryugenii]|uniref:Tetratricopeptide repeat protein n=1 Tax=Leptospira ryugenii TaxID=1917863 RepID=A0A2P2E032_9LEPT|nr:hypothetical protein [Leptospira ryugenii]GBF50247.1 hypothetical protein LPTSP4_17710 [Leptospira ryugenii]